MSNIYLGAKRFG